MEKLPAQQTEALCHHTTLRPRLHTCELGRDAGQKSSAAEGRQDFCSNQQKAGVGGVDGTLSAIEETDKAFVFRGNFIWHLAMGIWGSITSDLSIRVSDFPAEINIYKAIIRACLGNRH